MSGTTPVHDQQVVRSQASDWKGACEEVADAYDLSHDDGHLRRKSEPIRYPCSIIATAREPTRFLSLQRLVRVLDIAML